MFRAMIPPIFRSTRLCVTACGIVHPRCCWPVALKRCLQATGRATSWVHYTASCNTQYGAPENGRDHRPKHVELIGIINKPLLLLLVGVYVIYKLMNFYAEKEPVCHCRQISFSRRFSKRWPVARTIFQIFWQFLTNPRIILLVQFSYSLEGWHFRRVLLDTERKTIRINVLVSVAFTCCVVCGIFVRLTISTKPLLTFVRVRYWSHCQSLAICLMSVRSVYNALRIPRQ